MGHKQDQPQTCAMSYAKEIQQPHKAKEIEQNKCKPNISSEICGSIRPGDLLKIYTGKTKADILFKEEYILISCMKS